MTDITQLPGFDQKAYDHLVADTKGTLTAAEVNQKLEQKVAKEGLSFLEAVDTVKPGKPEIPSLSPPPPSTSVDRLRDWVGIPSPGALILSVVTQQTAEQRRMNKEEAWAESLALVKSMQNQADEMKKHAEEQFIYAVVAGAVQIAGGLASAVGSGLSLGKIAKSFAATDEALGNKLLQQGKAMGELASGINSVIGGVGKSLEAKAQQLGVELQARNKEQEAEQEKARALRDATKALDESLHELIQKALQAQAGIADSTNQAKTKFAA